MNIIPDTDCFFEEGQQDYKDGIDLEECPYDEGTDGQYGWIRGWKEENNKH
jgi:ribosome modulation factor